MAVLRTSLVYEARVQGAGVCGTGVCGVGQRFRVPPPCRRFTHFLQEKAEYRCSFKSTEGGGGGRGSEGLSSAGFDAPSTVVAPAATGPGEAAALLTHYTRLGSSREPVPRVPVHPDKDKAAALQ